MDVSAFENPGRIRYEEMLGSFRENKPYYEAIDHYRRLVLLKEKGVQIPAIYLSCGTEDYLIGQNRKMKAHLDSLGIPNEYREAPGEHNWKFWHPESVGVAEFHWKYFQSPAAGTKP
jgi:S-formylglutathione hydrolase FrmB